MNRLCASGMEAVNSAARAIRSNEGNLYRWWKRKYEPGAVRYGKGGNCLARSAEIYDTTIGWRFINPKLDGRYGSDSMPETGENVAEKFQIRREDQDKLP